MTNKMSVLYTLSTDLHQKDRISQDDIFVWITLAEKRQQLVISINNSECVIITVFIRLPTQEFQVSQRARFSSSVSKSLRLVCRL